MTFYASPLFTLRKGLKSVIFPLSYHSHEIKPWLWCRLRFIIHLKRIWSRKCNCNFCTLTKSSSSDVRSCFSPLCFLDWMASCQLTTMLTTVYSAPQSSPVILTLLLHRTSWVRGCCRANTVDVFVMKSIQNY